MSRSGKKKKPAASRSRGQVKTAVSRLREKGRTLMPTEGTGRPLSPTFETVDEKGYRYIQITPEWQAACYALPCFAALWWPGYGTTVIEDKIDGRPVIIQLWKGWCQQFLGLKDWPGGVGGEVGVYGKLPGRRIAETIPDVPSKYVAQLREQVAGLGDAELWWPIPDLVTEISLEFINPHSGEAVVKTDPEATYWQAKWIDLSSYHKYVDAQPGTWPFNKEVPSLAWDYHLKYTINGRTFPVWTDHK
jgi:hypothetical protein